MKYKLNFYEKNLRVDLSEKTIAVPPKKKFREVTAENNGLNWFQRQNPVINNDEGLGILFGVLIFVTLAFIIFAGIEQTRENPRTWVFLLNVIMCASTFTTVLVRNGVKSLNSAMWAFNTLIWFMILMKHI
jgi:hypothetical protein